MAGRDIKPGQRVPLPGMKGAREKAVVMYKYVAENADELSLEVGDVILVLEKELEDSGWWKGELNGRVGVFPDNFVELVPTEKVGVKPTVPILQKSKSQDKTPETEISRPFDIVNNKPSKSVADHIAAAKPLPLLPLKKNNIPAEDGKLHMDYTKHGTLDSVSAEQRLSHITANRAKAPQRRPPKHHQPNRDSVQSVESVEESTDDELSAGAQSADHLSAGSPNKNIPERLPHKNSHNNTDSHNNSGGGRGYVDVRPIVARNLDASGSTRDSSSPQFTILRDELIQLRAELDRVKTKHDREVSDLMKEIEEERGAVKVLTEELSKLKKLVRNKLDSG